MITTATPILPVIIPHDENTTTYHTHNEPYIEYNDSRRPFIPPGPIIAVHQRMLDSIMTPTLLNEDIDDTCLQYTEMIIKNTPESKLLPLQILDNKYMEINCGVCLEHLKIKERPIIKFNCNEHYFHYSCYQCMAEDNNKKKRIDYLFGQIKTPDEMFIIECPYCRKYTTVEFIYIKYPEITPQKNSDSNNSAHFDLLVSHNQHPNEKSPLVTKTII
jgi:hypothetical protein